MQIAYIIPDKCLRCKKCHALSVCPVGAIIRIDDEEPRIVESKLCHGCGDCVSRCPANAVILRDN